VGLVNEAVKDGVGLSRVANEGVPFVDGDLTGENGRATPLAFLEDLVELTAGPGVERFAAPIVEDEELDAGETAQDPSITAVTAGARVRGRAWEPADREQSGCRGKPCVRGHQQAKIGPRRSAQTKSDCRARRSIRQW
jgi:hypothetical protein